MRIHPEIVNTIVDPRAIKSSVEEGHIHALNKHIPKSVARIMVDLSNMKRGKRPRPQLDPSVTEILGCFSEKVAYALVSMVFDPKYLMTTGVHDVKKMTNDIKELNPSVRTDIIASMVQSAVQLHQLIHDGNPEGDREYTYFDNIENLKRGWELYSLRLNEEGLWEEDPAWANAFDDLVLKPLMVSALRGKREIEDFESFWCEVVGGPSEEDFLLYGEDAPCEPSLLTRFLKIKELAGDDHSIFDELFPVFLELIHKKNELPTRESLSTATIGRTSRQIAKRLRSVVL